MKLPACMMPDGGDPCDAFTALQEENEKLRAALQRIVDSDGRFDTMFDIAKAALSTTRSEP